MFFRRGFLCWDTERGRFLSRSLSPIAGVEYKPCRAGADMRKTKGTHVVTKLYFSWFDKEHIITIRENNATYLSLPIQQTRKFLVTFSSLSNNIVRDDNVHSVSLRALFLNQKNYM